MLDITFTATAIFTTLARMLDDVFRDSVTTITDIAQVTNFAQHVARKARKRWATEANTDTEQWQTRLEIFTILPIGTILRIGTITDFSVFTHVFYFLPHFDLFLPFCHLTLENSIHQCIVFKLDDWRLTTLPQAFLRRNCSSPGLVFLQNNEKVDESKIQMQFTEKP